MKKKINIALLIVMVIVYGGIAYKYVGKKPTQEQTIATSYTNNNIELPETVEEENTFILHLSNRDPFLDKKYKAKRKNKTASSRPQSVSRSKTSRQSIEKHWPVINYLGFTKSNNQTKKMAILRIDGKLYRKREGSSIEHIKILKIAGDSIRIMFNKKEKKYFYKNVK